MMDARLDPQVAARNLFWQGWKITEIAKQLGVKAPTVYSWKQRGNWDGGSPIQRVTASTEARLIQLVNLPKKSDGDYKEIRQLSQLIDQFSMPRNKNKAPEAMHLGTSMPDVPTIDNPPKEQRFDGESARVSKSKPRQNHFEPEQIKRLKEIFWEQSFDYQKDWYEAGKKYDWRMILKSRQIGATFYFAREAMVDALETGRNQIFLSASRAQAFQFKQYQIDLAEMVDVELRGDKIRIANNGASLSYLGTNSRTAQGRSGNVYIDEFFWIDKYETLRDLASAMASHSQYRVTEFSTPSDEGHEAYPYWTGEAFNSDRPRSEHLHLDVSHGAVSKGRLDADGKWRQIVTLDDAIASGCNLFDKEKLLLRYSPSRVEQLYNCKFAAPGESIFEYKLLMGCSVDSWDLWEDFYKPHGMRPVANLPVWLSYDPTETGDGAGLVIALAPRFNGDAFRVLDAQLLYGNDYEGQALAIKKFLEIYNVQKLIINTNGIGSAVFQLVQKFFPLVIAESYTAERKGLMINKAINLMRKKRVEWEVSNKDIPISFLSIRSQMTPSGKKVTYHSSRTSAKGGSNHGDIAWALLQLFVQEPLDEAIVGTASVQFS